MSSLRQPAELLARTHVRAEPVLQHGQASAASHQPEQKRPPQLPSTPVYTPPRHSPGTPTQLHAHAATRARATRRTSRLPRTALPRPHCSTRQTKPSGIVEPSWCQIDKLLDEARLEYDNLTPERRVRGSASRSHSCEPQSALTLPASGQAGGTRVSEGRGDPVQVVVDWAGVGVQGQRGRGGPFDQVS